MGRALILKCHFRLDRFRFNKGEVKSVTGFRDPTNELEKPHGEWNVVELVNRDGHVWQYVNGKLANEGTDAFPASGKILFQSEGAEVFFRHIKVYPLKLPGMAHPTAKKQRWLYRAKT